MKDKMIMRLTDDEYAALETEAKRIGTSLEFLFHEVLTKHIRAAKQPQHLWTTQEFQEHLFEDGLLTHIPTGEPDSEETKIERQQLGEIFGHGKPMSEMIIEDRGPY